MARYIDADALKTDILKKFKMNWEVPCSSEDRIIQRVVTDIRVLIELGITSDVVPRAEVETLKDNNEHLAVLLAEAKTEVAREIFGDVKKAIKEEVLDYCRGFESMETPEMQEYYKTKQNTAIYLYMKIDHLEKKYTEGAADNGGEQ